MPQPQNRFQIKLDGVIKTDPENWINFTPTTQRHAVYRTLLSTFSEGTIKLIKTAKNYVDGVYAQYGSAKSIDVEWLEYDYTTDTYVAIFALGRLNLSEKYKRSRDYTEVGFEPTSFIMNVLNRDEIKTSLQSLVDMDGTAITAFTNETHTITLSDQFIDFSAKYEHAGVTGLVVDVVAEDILYIAVPMFVNEIINNGVVTLLDKTMELSETVPKDQMVFNKAGDVTFDWTWLGTYDIYIKFGQTIVGYTIDAISTVSFVYVLNNGSEVVLDSDTFPATSGASVFKEITKATLTIAGISEGDVIRFYVKINNLTGSDPPKVTVTFRPNIELSITTSYADTTCEFMFPWEIFLRLCQMITGRNDCFRSTLFGRTDGEVKTYASDGDGAFYAITTPKLIRGFPLSSNPINSDLMSMFKNYDKLLLLGLGVVYESGVPYISIERLEDFMDGSSSATTFIAAYPGIDWTSATSYIWGSVNGGYSKYKLKDNPTIGSPHSKRDYIMPYLSEFHTMVYDNQCDFIASGHLIELLRRNRYIDGIQNDGDYDEDLIILHLERDGGTSFNRVLDADFSAISNIDNKATNSNLHLTPARNLLRQAPLLLAGLAKRIIDVPATTDLLRFQSGEGNTDAKTTVTGDTLVPEDADLTRTMANDVYSKAPLFDASELGKCTITITKAQRDLIKEGLLKMITVTDRGSTYTGFIESIKEVDLEKGIAELKFLSNTGI